MTCKDEGCPQYGTVHTCVNTSSATVPPPKGYALCCPSCGVWKLRAVSREGKRFWLCMGPANTPFGYIPGRGVGVVCGKVFSDLEVRAFIGLQMVEE